MLLRLYKKWLLRRLKKAGLQIADDCRLLAWPSCFGAEPFLVSIGRHVTITSRVRFITHDGGTWVFRDLPELREVIKYGRIIVHDNCFIGFGATILPGVSIGPNSIVAAGAVVEGAVVASAAIVAAPFAAYSCDNCGISFCNSCGYPEIAYFPYCDHC